ncbi:unnamed protein product, partial [Dicrocoelium dendriticum]
IPCEQIWKDFNMILLSKAAKNSCPMDPKLFDPLVTRLIQYAPSIENPVLWSGMGSFVTELCSASERCTSLETTLTGK